MHHQTDSNDSLEHSLWPALFTDMPSLSNPSPFTTSSSQATFAPPRLSFTPSSNSEEISQGGDTSTSLQLPSHVSQPPAVPVSRLVPITCATCHVQFGTQSALSRHLAKQHRFRCEIAGCDEVFNTKRTRDRHYNTKRHAADRVPHHRPHPFRCRCGKASLRKDHHTRHLKSCEKPSTMLYHCNCGNHDVADNREHVAHVRDCRNREDNATVGTSRRTVSG